MAEPKCPECEGTELDVKVFSNKHKSAYYAHVTSVFYCLKGGKIISVNTVKGG